MMDARVSDAQPHTCPLTLLIALLTALQVLQPESVNLLLHSPAFLASGVAADKSGDTWPQTPDPQQKASLSSCGPDAPYVRVLLPLLHEWAEANAAGSTNPESSKREAPGRGEEAAVLLRDQMWREWEEREHSVCEQGFQRLKRPQKAGVQARQVLSDAGCGQALSVLEALRLSPEVKTACLKWRAMLGSGNAAPHQPSGRNSASLFVGPSVTTGGGDEFREHKEGL